MNEHSLEYYLDAFEHLKRAPMRGFKAPHKPVLLLAVINLVEQGKITDNHIELTDDLIAEFKRLWSELVDEKDAKDSYFLMEGLDIEITRKYPFKCSIENPFYYMMHEPFWRLIPSEKFKKMNSYSSIGSLRKNFMYAEIDEELFDFMKSKEFMIMEKLMDMLKGD